MQPREVREYLKEVRPVRGWFWPAAAYLFGMIDELQKSLGITGNLFEIGAFHGKSTLLLGRMTRPECGEQLGVCDAFDAPDAASALAGRGFYREFAAHIEAAFPRRDFLRVFIKSSSDLTPEETTTNCRFFHVDGDHDAAQVTRDLAVAAGAIGEAGVIAVDDIYNFAWPGVAEGFFSFMNTHAGQFVPLAMGFNKLLLVRPAARKLYEDAFEDPDACWQFIPRGPVSIKKQALCGMPTYLFHVPSYKSPDPLRQTLTLLHQHSPRWSDRLSRLIRYHDRVGA